MSERIVAGISPALKAEAMRAQRPFVPGAIVEGRIGAAPAGATASVLVPGGALQVRGLPRLPPGTLVVLRLPDTASEPVSLLSARSPDAASAGTKAPAVAAANALEQPKLFQTWPTLDRALAIASEHRAAIAKPDARLGQTVHDFLAAARTTALPAALGELARALAAKDGAVLAENLTEEWRDLNRLARSAEHDGWKLALVPFAAGDGARLMRIFMRPASPERAQDDGARFAVELDDSPYGSLQIDGLARPKRLDLALRTAREIPLAMRRELTAIFTASRSALALAGALAIQHRPDLASLATPAPSPGLII